MMIIVGLHLWQKTIVFRQWFCENGFEALIIGWKREIYMKTKNTQIVYINTENCEWWKFENNVNNSCVRRMCMNCFSSVLVVQVVLHTRPRIITI